jgi:cysteine synthase A
MLVPAARNSILDLVRPTPTVRLGSIPGPDRAPIFVKLEQLSPTGSHKDRIARAMLAQAESQGLLAPEATVIEASCGNLGVALALACAERGCRLIVVMPQSVNPEFRPLIEAYGARIEVTPAELGMSGAIARAEELASACKGAYMPAQYENPANWVAHQRSTGAELVRAIELSGFKANSFVMTVGTGGTLAGVGCALRRTFPGIRLVAVDLRWPSGAAKSMRVEGGGGAVFPGSALIADAVIEVEEEAAREMAGRLAREEGLLVGISSGANVVAALQLARGLGQDQAVYTLCCDTGERYFNAQEGPR